MEQLIVNLREKLKKFRKAWKHEVVYLLFIVIYIYANLQIVVGLPDTVLDTIIIQIIPVYITVEGVLIGLATQIKTKWLRDLVAFTGITSMLLAVRTLIIATYQHLQLNQSSLTGTTSGFVTTSLLFLIFVEVYAFALLLPVSGKRDRESKTLDSEEESKRDRTILRMMDKKKVGEKTDEMRPDNVSQSSEEQTTQQNSFEREERRSILVVGLLGAVVGFLLFLRPVTISGVVFGLFLIFVVLFLFGYAASMIVYFSDDIWKPGLRLWAKRIGLLFLYAYTLGVVLFMIGFWIDANYGGVWGAYAEDGFILLAAIEIILMWTFRIRKVKIE